MSSPRELNIALMQSDLVWQDPAANRQALGAQIRAAGGADLIVLPETFTTGFTLEAIVNAEPAGGPTREWLVNLATTRQVDICGSVIVAADGKYYNRLIWASRDGTLYHYDKRHLFRMANEHEQFSAGRERLIVRIGDWRICPMICYDLRFPVWSRNRDDYDLLLYVANWPQPRHSAWTTLLPARAVENLCYVAGVNRAGVDGNGIASAGESMVVDYLGRQVAAAGDQPATVTATLSLDDLERYRRKFPAHRDADAFTLHTDPDSR
ncbi:MAG: amidohydrolase [Gammaproteobacteria bacterium]|jgi:predicted amidohydrolase|nr:amidohydrolase [Gammaproteobacteria bacterium]